MPPMSSSSWSDSSRPSVPSSTTYPPISSEIRPDHLQPLHHGGHVPDGDQVLDLERRQRPADLVQARLVPLERRQGLVRAGQDGVGVLQHVPQAADVQRDDPHRLAHRDDREAGLLRDALGGAVPRAGLRGLDGRVRQQLDGGPQDPGGVLVEHDGAVHLGQLAQPGRGELDVEHEPAGADRLDGPVEAEDHERAGATAQDALQTVPQLAARGDGGERGPQQVVGREGGGGHGADPTRGDRHDGGRRTSRQVVGEPSAPSDVAACRGSGGGGGPTDGAVVARTASSRFATSTTTIPSGPSPGSTEPVGTTARVNPSRAASASRRPTPCDRADLAGEADLAERDQVGHERLVLARADRGERDREVGRGLEHAPAADRRDVDVLVAETQTGAALEHGEDHGQPARVDAARRASRVRGRARRDQRLQLDRQRDDGRRASP